MLASKHLSSDNLHRQLHRGQTAEQIENTSVNQLILPLINDQGEMQINESRTYKCRWNPINQYQLTT